MYQSTDLLEAAKSIRPFLSQLLDHSAQEVDSQLATLIARNHAGESVDDAITNLLVAHAKTRHWMKEFLQKSSTRNAQSFESLPGLPSEISAPKYICPVGDDFIWYRLDVSDSIPYCPTHQVQLTLAEET